MVIMGELTVPSSGFLRARIKWACDECGELIPRGMRYYRRRLLTLCLMCHGSAEGALGPQAGRPPPPPSSMTGCRVHGDNNS